MRKVEDQAILLATAVVSVFSPHRFKIDKEGWYAECPMCGVFLESPSHKIDSDAAHLRLCPYRLARELLDMRRPLPLPGVHLSTD